MHHECNTGAELNCRVARSRVDNDLCKGEYVGVRSDAVFDLLENIVSFIIIDQAPDIHTAFLTLAQD